MTLRERPFENIVGKGENAGNQHSLPFPHGFHVFPNFYFVVSKIRAISPFPTVFSKPFTKLFLLSQPWKRSPDFKNIVGNGEKGGNLFFPPQCFLFI